MQSEGAARHVFSPGGTLAALAAALLPGCGAGVVAAVAGSGGSGGDGPEPVLEAFALDGAKVSPGRLRLGASQPVRVALLYDLGGGEEPMTRLEGVVGNEVDVPADEVVTLDWDFAAEAGIGTAELVPGVTLVARTTGGA